MRPNRRLPDGRLTNSVEEYIDAWESLALPLTTILGWHLCAMDPRYTFEDPYGERVHLTVSQVEQLVNKLTTCAACGFRAKTPKEAAQEEQAIWEAYRKGEYADLLEQAGVTTLEEALESTFVVHEGDGTEDDPPILLGEHVLHTLTVFATSHRSTT